MLACEIPATGPAAQIAAQVAAQIPALETDRLILRAPRIQDFDTYAQIVTTPHGAHLDITSREEAWLDFAQMVAGWALRGHGIWSVETRSDAALLGFVLLSFDHEDPEPELGYVFTETAAGRGYATEAAIAVRDYAFDTLNWTTLASFIAPENTRSIALATRMGAALDGQIDYPDGSATLIYRHTAAAGH